MRIPKLIAATAVALWPLRLVFPQTAAPSVVISQIYRGGGNTGAVLRNDFVQDDAPACGGAFSGG